MIYQRLEIPGTTRSAARHVAVPDQADPYRVVEIYCLPHHFNTQVFVAFPEFGPYPRNYAYFVERNGILFQMSGPEIEAQFS